MSNVAARRHLVGKYPVFPQTTYPDYIPAFNYSLC